MSALAALQKGIAPWHLAEASPRQHTKIWMMQRERVTR